MIFQALSLLQSCLSFFFARRVPARFAHPEWLRSNKALRVFDKKPHAWVDPKYGR
jgi:hypothetical protein